MISQILLKFDMAECYTFHYAHFKVSLINAKNAFGTFVTTLRRRPVPFPILLFHKDENRKQCGAGAVGPIVQLRAFETSEDMAFWVVTPCSSAGFLLGTVFDHKH
jgi:hypothetical protein